MALIKSISGIRGTIGGLEGEGLTPPDILKITAAYGEWIKNNSKSKSVVVGMDARRSGPMVSKIVVSTLQFLGIDVIDLGLSTTPTVEMAVTFEKAGGGIIITASHNPEEWNALKLLNSEGEFLSPQQAQEVLKSTEDLKISYESVNNIGKYLQKEDYFTRHISTILKHPFIDVEAIKQREYRVAVDAVNSSGGIIVPKLLEALGVSHIKKLYCEPTGKFPHDPEPVPGNLAEISAMLKNGSYDLGIVVDPDVDRLALICEDGSFFGEEYTLVAAADYVLSKSPGNTVSNLSSSRALKDITEKYGGTYYSAAVGEINVVEEMKKRDAVIGGEGNGGVIFPDFHYGRDAIVGIALILSLLAQEKIKVSQLRKKYPDYYIIKNKIELTPSSDPKMILNHIKERYSSENIIDIDGVKIEFENSWVHLRKSNTEPVIRIIAESDSENSARNLTEKFIDEIKEVIPA